jgi:hypothetical protein
VPAIIGIGAQTPAPGPLNYYGECGIFGASSSGVGVSGNSESGDGVSGGSTSGAGVSGGSDSGTGVSGFSTSGTGVSGKSFSSGIGVSGSSGSGAGVSGSSDAGDGVQGSSVGGAGVTGKSHNASGVSGISDVGFGLYGTSAGSDGVHGETQSDQHAGVSGINNSGGEGGPGVYGSSANMDGVQGWSHSIKNAGVSGRNDSGGYGVWALARGPKPNSGGIAGYFDSDGNVAVKAVSTGDGFDAIVAQSSASLHAAVSAQNSNGGYGLWASSPNGVAIKGIGAPAGYFQGDVHVTGDVVLINMPASGDIAEDFDIEEDADNVEPGTVVVIGADGKLRACDKPYDSQLAGVVSGAGTFRPAVVLQRIETATRRSPIALLGKVFCKVDATFGAIAAGELLTTSATPGHAMKVADRSRAIGSILGKALAPHQNGCGLIPILVSLY